MLSSSAFLKSFWILKHIWPHECWVKDLRRIFDMYWLSTRNSIRMVRGTFSKHQCLLGKWDMRFPLLSLWLICVHMHLCVWVGGWFSSQFWYRGYTRIQKINLGDISVFFLCFVIDYVTRNLLFFESWKEYTLNYLKLESFCFFMFLRLFSGNSLEHANYQARFFL